jgi:hypothetical protein
MIHFRALTCPFPSEELCGGWPGPPQKVTQMVSEEDFVESRWTI